jgi:hypothetical protein
VRNVQCAGKRIDIKGSTVPIPIADPCGWKGKRLGWISVPQRPDETIEQMVARVATKKPCPRCGGRVQLIPEVER